MLFIDFSSAFNTIIPQQLINKLNLLGLNNSLCNWILDFLTEDLSQSVSAATPRALPHWAQVPHKAVYSARCSSRCWPTTALPNSAPTTSSILQMTHQWVSSGTTMKRTTERKGHSWLNGVAQTTCPSMWVRQRKLWWTSGWNSADHPSLTIDTSTVERVSSTKFLGVYIKENLTWTTNTTSLSKKAQQRLHFLCWLKRASLPPPILTTFYRGTIESVLTSCFTVWYRNCSAATCGLQDPPADNEHSCKDHRCPSPLHPGHFSCTMLQ